MDGIDLDAPSIDAARANAQAAGVADRARFEVRDAADRALAGRHDVVTAFECIHDHDVERFMYGWIITCCLPAGLADRPSAGTGTVMRAGTLERYARQAGFSGIEVLPIDHETFRYYRLVP